MFTTISLHIPSSWQIPEVLSSSTADENKIILESGCQILMASRNESAGLNNRDELRRLRNDSEAKIAEARSRFNNELEEEKRNSQKLLSEKDAQINEDKRKSLRLLSEKDAIIDVLTVYKSSSETRISETRQQERNSLTEEMAYLKDEVIRLKRVSEDEISKIRHSSEEERLRSLNESKLEREASQVAIEREREAARLEREKILSTGERERDILMQQIQELHRSSTAIQLRRANSSTKGGDNEREFLDIIMNTFGPAQDFVYIKKEFNAGDHRFDWEGYRIMVENKKGYTESALRGTGGLPKAIKDFTNNSDCNLLIFISEDTPVPDHTKPGDIDIGMIDKRPAIFIGNFARHDDKISYINSILMPIMRILLKVYKQNNVNEVNDSEKLGDVIHRVQCLKNNYITKFTDFQKTIKAFERAQTSGIDGIKSSANSLLELFNSSLNSILNEETKVVEESESGVSYTNEALQAMKMEPELQEIAKKLNISGRTKLTKPDLIKRIIEKNVIDL